MGCSAVYHLACVEPPMTEVPEDDWHCPVCIAHKIEGVYDCISDSERSGLLFRQDPLGSDRHGRRYWFLARRIFVEKPGELWYYSSGCQLEELLEVLDEELWETDLVYTLQEAGDDIRRQMNITDVLT